MNSQLNEKTMKNNVLSIDPAKRDTVYGRKSRKYGSLAPIARTPASVLTYKFDHF